MRLINRINMSKENEIKNSGDERLQGVQSSLTRAEQFIEKNKKLLTYIIGGITLIVVGIWGYNRFILGPKITKAQDDIFMAQKYYELDSLNLALNGDGQNPGFLEIIDQYGGTPSGNLAHYYTGMIYLKQGKFQDAVDELEDFDADGEIIGPMAVGSTGDAYLELGDKEKALDKYLEAADMSKNDLTCPIYLMRSAFIYEDMGQWDKALKQYETIEKEHFKSYEAREIKKYIARAKTMGGIE